MQFITDGVGTGQRNSFDDVRVVQQLLNLNLDRLNLHRHRDLHPIDATGLFDRRTAQLLHAYCSWVGHPGPTAVLGPADAVVAKILDRVLSAASRFMHRSIGASIVRPRTFAGDLASTNWIVLTMVRGALAWRGVFPPAPSDPVFAALDANRVADFRQFRTLCRMRRSHALVDILKTIAPTIRRSKVASPDAIADSVALAMSLADILTPWRKAAFLAQIAAESDGFRAVREYASGDEYEDRKDLGNVLPGDGRRFAGRGYIQLTGRSNYTQAWHALGLPVSHNAALQPKLKSDIDVPDPAYAETLEGAAKVTAWYWNKNKLNAIADRLGKTATQQSVLLELSIAINGKNKSTGLPNGWEARQRYFGAAKHALGLH